MKKAFINWSSGKDAAYALYRLRMENEYSIEKLLTTVNTQSNAVSMHGVKMELLQKQAEALGIPLQIISIPGEIPAEKYNRIMQKEISGLVSQGFSHSVFGDI
ncbi:MAG TPA: ATP-binding protein, partial [Salinimicrobium sp.]|nr:ATP-binding protein [Salinimicrobium sp.]